MFGYAFGQASQGPVEPGGFCYQFGITTVGDKSFRSLDAQQASIMKMALVGWEAKEPPSGPLVEDALAIVHAPPDADDVLAVPFIQSAPRQVGNMYRWVEMQLSRGKGVIVIPPADFNPCGDLLRWTTGELRAIATTDLSRAAALAGPDKSGVVVFSPAGGWVGMTVPPGTKPAAPGVSWQGIAVFGVALAAGWWLLSAR